MSGRQASKTAAILEELRKDNTRTSKEIGDLLGVHDSYVRIVAAENNIELTAKRGRPFAWMSKENMAFVRWQASINHCSNNEMINAIVTDQRLDAKEKAGAQK